MCRYEVPDMSHVGIVTYNSRAVVTHGLTLVTSDNMVLQCLDQHTQLRLLETVQHCAELFLIILHHRVSIIITADQRKYWRCLV